jgi:hypothetical protein
MLEQPTLATQVPEKESTRDQPPARVDLRELLAVLGLVVLADLTIYRGHGFAGAAGLFVAATALLALGAPHRRMTIALGAIEGLVLVLAAALAWCGSIGQVVLGAALVVAFAMTLSGMMAYVPHLFAFACLTCATCGAGLAKQLQALERASGLVPRATWIKVVLPLAAVIVFGTLFVCANPDEARIVGEWLTRFGNAVWDTIRNFSPTVMEVLLWVAAAWIGGGLLRPLVRLPAFRETAAIAAEESEPATSSTKTLLYAAFRNLLVAVIVLFAVYLVFEFNTLWFRVFPKGFYYSGYAHEGAAWLTAALALATIVLSVIFRTGALRDAGLGRLKKLAWIWSAENVLLAVAAYHRMHIYIGFNGMTRMRVVGLLGMTAVLVGFLLVVWKIAHGRGFVWLVNRQLWTLAATFYLYAVLPVDMLAHSYNVRRILAGDPAPSVQISVHPIDSGGVLALPPLVHSSDEIIREGVRALLAQRALQVDALERDRALTNWTSFQLADRLLDEHLDTMRSDWAEFVDPAKCAAALERFRAYAYQWY